MFERLSGLGPTTRQPRLATQAINPIRDPLVKHEWPDIYSTLCRAWRAARIGAVGHARLRGARERAAGAARSAAQNLRCRTSRFVEVASGQGRAARSRPPPDRDVS